MYAQKVLLPKLPDEFHERLRHIGYQGGELIRVDSGNRSNVVPEDIERWLNTNVLSSGWYLLHYTASINPVPHVDGTATCVKLQYIVDPGGDEVLTTYHDSLDPASSIIQTNHFKEKEWALLRVDIPHRVKGFDLARKRILLGCLATQLTETS